MNPITWLLLQILGIYSWIVIAAIILNILVYFNIVNRYQPFVQQVGVVLSRLTEPLLARIRKILPPMGGFDFSPVLLLLAIEFLQRVLIYYFV